MGKDYPKRYPERRLTAREREVLGLVAKGLGCEAIARRCGVALCTVKAHRASIVRKFELHSYAGLVALSMSLCPPGLSSIVDMTLTGGERQVVSLVARGLTTKEIAAELRISPHTVNTHRGNVMRRCGARKIACLLVATRRWTNDSDA